MVTGTNPIAAITMCLMAICPITAWANHRIMMVCEGTYVLLQPKDKKAVLTNHDPPVAGSLEVEENVYRMVFPKTGNSWEIHLRVNRYTRAFEWEHGSPPFNELNPKNVYRSGSCEKTDPERKF